MRRALARPRPGRGREVRRAGVPGRAAPGVSSSDLALLGVVLAQEERINALERRLGHVAAVLQGMGMDA